MEVIDDDDDDDDDEDDGDGDGDGNGDGDDDDGDDDDYDDDDDESFTCLPFRRRTLQTPVGKSLMSLLDRSSVTSDVMREMLSGIWVILFCERSSSSQPVRPTNGRTSTM